MDARWKDDCPNAMNLIERYIFRRATRLTVITLAATTVVVLITQVLIYVNVLTDSGQAITTFLNLAVMLVPAMAVVVAPFALLIGASQTLSGMNADSELAVIEAAGGSQKITAKPIVVLGVILTLMTLGIALFVEPWSNRQIRTIVSEAGADLVRLAVQSGSFKRIDEGLYIQIAEQLPGGGFGGIFIADMRDDKTELLYYARKGVILPQGDRDLLVMSEGEIQRRSVASGEISVIQFASYAIDFSQFSPAGKTRHYLPKERSTAFLLDPDPNDHIVKIRPTMIRSELNRRFSEWLFPIAFGLIAVYFAGGARSNRQERLWSLTVAAVVALSVRGAGFFFMNASGMSRPMTVMTYAVPLATIAIFSGLLVSGRQLRIPAWLDRRGSAFLARAERLRLALHFRMAGYRADRGA
ncbi:MAG: LptF/LptG family permease [Mesorhizobium sp.]|nr:LptF/LptG family permease [Mesorhizobium sp.]MCO5159716.1 LptF/LptG family permease [Mesorhizobium sp.]